MGRSLIPLSLHQLILLCYVVVSAGACAHKTERPLTPIRRTQLLEDLTPSFDRFALQASVQTNLILPHFRRELFPIAPRLYGRRLAQWEKEGRAAQAMIDAHIKDYLAGREAFDRLRVSLALDLADAVKIFKRHFSDFKMAKPIKLVHSLGELNGGVRDDDFFIGVDVVMKAHDWGDNRPFLLHELFHLYHIKHNRKLFSKPLTLAERLWVEGLATAVARHLAPGATEKELMLDTPDGLSKRCAQIGQKLLEKLNVELLNDDPERVEAYFSHGAMDAQKDLGDERRIGYCVGEKLVRHFLDNRLTRPKIKKSPEQWFGDFSQLTSAQIIWTIRYELKRWVNALRSPRSQ